jgi:DNA-binding phage protein
MTTYPKTLLIDAIYSDKPLRPFQISYFAERYRNRLHAEILKLFNKVSKERGLTRADLARRLNKRPEQITRWLSAPGNCTQDTVSELMLAMGYEPSVGSTKLGETSDRSNYFHPVAERPTVSVSNSTIAAQASTASVGRSEAYIPKELFGFRVAAQ